MFAERGVVGFVCGDTREKDFGARKGGDVGCLGGVKDRLWFGE